MDADTEQAVLTAYRIALDFGWLLKLVFLTAFTLLMVMIVAWLYTGEQQAERGPISIKAWSPAAAKEAFHAPDPIVTNILDEKSAVCVFYLSYIDARGRPARQRLLKQRFRLKKLNVRRASSVHDFGGLLEPRPS
jgi:flagellar basal body-associated protein FliL